MKYFLKSYCFAIFQDINREKMDMEKAFKNTSSVFKTVFAQSLVDSKQGKFAKPFQKCPADITLF